MNHWLDLIAYFFGGMFLTNAIPHWVSGMMGQAFQSPFAKPPGVGLSSATVNVLWGLLNLVIAYLLIACVGVFDIHSAADVLGTGIGMLAMSIMAAKTFGKFHGGDLSKK
jgi:hypothetical protein